MRQTAALVLALVFVAGCNCTVTPLWPLEWTSNFNETAVDLNNTSITGQTDGIFYYNFGGGKQRIDRVNGQYDRICGTQKPGVSASCSQIITQEALWVIYPDTQECCECCTKVGGCSVVSNSWLATSHFQGTETYAGYEVNVWEKQGVGETYYYETTVGKFPVAIFQTGADYMQFDPTTYSTKNIDNSVFDLPGYCGGKCTTSWYCNSHA